MTGNGAGDDAEENLITLCPREDFKKAVEKELTGRETEPWEIVYFKLCQNQMPLIQENDQNFTVAEVNC